MSLDRSIIHHGSPLFYNAGEMVYNLIVNAFTFTVALIFSSAIVATIKECSDDSTGAAWIAFFVVLIIVIIVIIVLAHSKRHMMHFAHRFSYLHSHEHL